MKFIYHITEPKTWQMALTKNLYDFCTLESSGFIHASTAKQYLNIVNTKFKNKTELLLLKIDTDRIDQKIIYENCESGTEQYPHIYGPFKTEAVVEVFKLHSQQGELFTDVLV